MAGILQAALMAFCWWAFGAQAALVIGMITVIAVGVDELRAR